MTEETRMEGTQTATRLRIYLGEEKREGDLPLYQAIVRHARQRGLAGVTVLRGTQGYGRSTRLHTADVLFSDDLPVVIEIVDLAERVEGFAQLLDHLAGIGLITCETVAVRGTRRL
jgi:PII-like signaling protein